MKPYLLRLAVALFLVCAGDGLCAQSQPPAAESTVEMTPDELRVIVRRLAILRRQRLQQMQRPVVRKSVRRRAGPTKPQGAARQVVRTEVIIRERTDGGPPDTLVNVLRGEERGDARYATLRLRDDAPEPAPRTYPGPVDTRPEPYAPYPIRTEYEDDDKNDDAADRPDLSADLYDLRQRLVRQERMLEEVLNRPTPVAPPAPPAPASAPTSDPEKTELMMKRMMLETEAGQSGVTSDDLRELSREVSQTNAELRVLRERLRYEEDRRARAERERTDALRRLERTTDRTFDRTTQTVVTEPVVVEKEVVRIVRDTVYVDRVSTTPVYIETPTRPDTVVMIQPAAPTVIRDTVVRDRVVDRAVIQRDTVKLAAREPLDFPTIFFDNNSSVLNARHRSLLAETARQLVAQPAYSVRLTGFASPSGNADYNQRLSARRAAAVRQGLEDAGVSAARIYVVPGGIDYQPANAAAARRVEVKGLPKQ